MIDVGRYPGSRTVLGRLMRAPLGLIPKGAVVPILQGPLRGKKWIVGSGISRLWLGSYEPEKMDLAASILKPGDVAFDVGANVGIYTLLFSSLVGPTGRVVAFEPWPRNVDYLRKHLALNQATNTEVVSSAVSSGSGRTKMDGREHSSTVRISTEGTFEVPTTSLDDFVAERQLRPSVIKIDVEGAETDVLRGAVSVLKNLSPVLLLATHSDSLKQDCVSLLKSLDYQIAELGPEEPSDELIATPKRG